MGVELVGEAQNKEIKVVNGGVLITPESIIRRRKIIASLLSQYTVIPSYRQAKSTS
jgi:hypothetical protein